MQSGTGHFRLIIGNRQFSSWSLRGWLAARLAGIELETVEVPLYRPDTATKLAPLSPSLLVPCLEHGALRVWDSLAIAEYLNEIAPGRGLWPAERARRAHARSIVAEMHSGFLALRQQWPCAFLERRAQLLDAAGRRDVERVLAIWTDCRARYGADGEYLLGRWTLADVFYAPVVSRFETYGLEEIPESAARYAESVRRHPDVVEWMAAAAAGQASRA